MSQCPIHKPLLDFETFAKGTPRDYIDELRAGHRILWEPDDYATGGHWLLFQQADIDYVLRTTDLFTSAQGPILEDIPAELLSSTQITFLDPPAHRKYRSMVEYAFRPGLLKAREPVMRDMARGIIDQVIGKGECEFISEVAIRLPMRVMYYLLGVRPDDEAHVVGLTNTMLLADDPDFAEDRAQGFRASMQLMEFGARLAADHRANPRDDITMEVLSSELDGERLGDVEFGRFFLSLIAGGLETTRNTLGWSMVEFVRNPDQYAKLRADPALVPGTVEEILRYRGPVVYLRRTATQDTELAGEKIEKGDKVICMISACNRDPALFERPHEFDITRDVAATRRNYRTFGGGPHYCLGIHQARMNLTVMLSEIARRMTGLRLLAEPKPARSLFMDGFKELRLGFEAM